MSESEGAPAPAFEPLRDMLGIEQSLSSPTQAPTAAAMGVSQQATLEHTAADRVAHVKGLMGGNNNRNVGAFGAAGTNMNPQPSMQQQMAMQQQQAMMAYQTYAGLAAYQTNNMNQQQMMAYQTNMQQQQQMMAAYQTMNAQALANQQQQMVLYQTQQNQMAMQPNNNQVALYNPAPQGNQVALVPAMEAQQVARAPQEYRVQRSEGTTRVSDSDKAFGPLIDRLKKAAAEKGSQGKQ